MSLKKLILFFCVGVQGVAMSGCAPGILWACARPEMTAVSLNPCDGCMYGKDSGIPFYLPKPLLIVSKNFRHIETPTVGLTNTAPIPTGYDDQSKYADLNARTNFNGLAGPSVSGASSEIASPAVNTGTSLASPPILHSTGVPVTPGVVSGDGLAPETFYTYQIVYVPDMTKRYGLKIRGGPGEIRAAMNLVNGWQFTGTGPVYMKDSSTAQNILADGISMRLGGAAAADVLNAGANLAKAFPPGGKQSTSVPSDDERVTKLAHTIAALPANAVPMSLVDFAEIHIYDSSLTPDGQMVWQKIDHIKFDRQYLGMKKTEALVTARAETPKTEEKKDKGTTVGAAQGASVSPDVVRSAIAGIFGVPTDSQAIKPAGERQGGAVAGVPTGGVNQIQVDCGGSGKCAPSREFNLFRFGSWFHKAEPPPRPKIQNRFITLPDLAVPTRDTTETTPETKPDASKKLNPGGAAQGGQTAGSALPAIINQPIFNQPSAQPVLPNPQAANPQPPGPQAAGPQNVLPPPKKE